MSQEKGSPPRRNCLNIFFPQQVEATKAKLKHYLYGVRTKDTCVVIHVTHKHNGNFAKGHREGVQIVGELIFTQDANDVYKTSALKGKEEIRCNYLYVAHYGGRPILISGQTKEIKNQDALFILYNLSKYIYIISDDHVSKLVCEALRRDGMLAKKGVKKNGTEECHSGGDKLVLDDICKRSDNEGDTQEKSPSDRSHQDGGVDKDGQTEHTDRVDHMNRPNCSSGGGGGAAKEANEADETKEADEADKANEANGANEANEANEANDQALNMHEIIILLNKKNSYAEMIEKGGEENGPHTNQDDSTNRNEQNLGCPILALLFLTYLVSSVCISFYYLLCILGKINARVFSSNIKNTLSFFKERLHIHSEWHPLLTSLMKSRHNPSDYAKYKELLLIRLCNFVIDVLLGFFLFIILSHEIIDLRFAFQKASVLYDSGTLTSILGTLLQNPLGLKLNNNFTSFIGSIIVSILDKWDYFKNVFPLKSSSAVHLLKLSSLCGVSFFLSFFMDYLKLITAHVTLIFAFLTKILSIFHSNMYSLYLLFNGKKWNILKLRVDTNYYTNEEVILGTVLFTILIFLYPTVFVLFLVFGIIYVIIGRIIYCLSLLKEIILYAPFYVLLLRDSQNGYINKGIRLAVGRFKKGNQNGAVAKWCRYKMHNVEWTELPKSHYLLLENANFAFFDKIKLFVDIFVHREGAK
ncbi:N-acetylglucosamine transferase [Plasmodium cynomolgi strain B]|uniref:N-acetylglucosamine transferase n=1 Tax=Plasmodium cynomolgi (strain B) TaxID=1120755 RepID=K6UDX6_PLACD|nr:N-acetylglucosamine transferase [Plasmodium cynomolgi strain B]GAB67366.1 N-acetylglucosamine transferase [Plasmodium cynomolgi strain B]